MPSTPRAESFEAVDVHGVAQRRSPSEPARRHWRERACPVVSLALEKRLFLNVRRKRLWCHFSAKSFAISTNGSLRSESSRQPAHRRELQESAPDRRPFRWRGSCSTAAIRRRKARRKEARQNGIWTNRFATAAHLRSWAGLCPRNDESAGKRRSTRLRRGAPWLKAMLVQCAWAATRTKATYLHAQFVRLRGRRGPKKAICAVAASILTAAYHMLKDGTFYEDLGAVHFDRRRPETQARRLLKRLAELGFSVELKPAAAVS